MRDNPLKWRGGGAGVVGGHIRAPGANLNNRLSAGIVPEYYEIPSICLDKGGDSKSSAWAH